MKTILTFSRLSIKILFILCSCLEARENPIKIALTFDDFPMESSVIFEKESRARIYAQTLAELNIQTAFFCIGQQLSTDSGRNCLALIQDHLVANHSFTHPHLSACSLVVFEDELQKTEELLCEEANFRKWFRFPYLDYGDRSSLGGSNRKRCAAFSLLKQCGYQHGYITINTFDWYIDGELKKAVKEGKMVDWDNLRTAYLTLLEEWMDAYHERWSGLLRSKFVHVLLLHQNDLNAFFLKDIVALINQKEWLLVSPDEAFCNPIPYLSKFANTKIRLFKGVTVLNTSHIDEVLKTYNVFE